MNDANETFLNSDVKVDASRLYPRHKQQTNGQSILTQDAEPVVEGDDDDVATHPVLGVTLFNPSTAEHEATPVHPHHHRHQNPRQLDIQHRTKSVTRVDFYKKEIIPTIYFVTDIQVFTSIVM